MHKNLALRIMERQNQVVEANLGHKALGHEHKLDHFLTKIVKLDVVWGRKKKCTVEFYTLIPSCLHTQQSAHATIQVSFTNSPTIAAY